jgi:YkoY family integral membrane protein
MPLAGLPFIAPLAEARLFGQSFELHDILIVGLLVVLEAVLSIDNALVLGLLAKRLPKHLQSKALTFGLIGALVFRILAIVTAGFLLRWTFAKFLGGAYLVYVALAHFISSPETDDDATVAVGPDGQPQLVHASTGEPVAPAGPVITKTKSGKPLSVHSLRFWKAVLVIELTDIAFAVDSIVAAMGLVGQQTANDTGAHDKLWIVVAGGMLGVILMRFAAVLFIKLLERFPRFETSAYLLVIVIGVKLLVDWWFNTPQTPHRVSFHDPHSPAFWIFWVVMLLSFCVGFIPGRKAAHHPTPPPAAEDALPLPNDRAAG